MDQNKMIFFINGYFHSIDLYQNNNGLQNKGNLYKVVYVTVCTG